MRYNPAILFLALVVVAIVIYPYSKGFALGLVGGFAIVTLVSLIIHRR